MNNIDYLSRKTLKDIYDLVEEYFELPHDFGEVTLSDIRMLLSDYYENVDFILNSQARRYDQYINRGD
ncbi:hypothetical protein CYJ57_03120 [Falseniella ignava]|uniref:Uncharacterized protein n=1 Tax=Falseniella ignava TaxID=137730 RepID=A0A2I1K230_9LACT|nr:hypothetical protein CYJ57_03120 [Falseniella ignava]